MTTTYAPPDINTLITTALKDVIKQAVEAHIDDKLEALDVDVASTLVYFNRKYKDLEDTNKQRHAQIVALEKRVETLSLIVTAQGDEHTRVRKTEADIKQEIANVIKDLIDTFVKNAVEDRIDSIVEEMGIAARLNNVELQIHELHQNQADRAFEREDIVADMVEACVNEAFKDIDLSDQVRNVLADARICI